MVVNMTNHTAAVCTHQIAFGVSPTVTLMRTSFVKGSARSLLNQKWMGAEIQDDHGTDAHQQTLTKVMEFQEDEYVEAGSLHPMFRRAVHGVAAQDTLAAAACVVIVDCGVQFPQHGEHDDGHDRYGAVEHDGAAEGLKITLSVFHDTHDLRRCPSRSS